MPASSKLIPGRLVGFDAGALNRAVRFPEHDWQLEAKPGGTKSRRTSGFPIEMGAVARVGANLRRRGLVVSPRFTTRLDDEGYDRVHDEGWRTFVLEPQGELCRVLASPQLRSNRAFPSVCICVHLWFQKRPASQPSEWRAGEFHVGQSDGRVNAVHFHTDAAEQFPAPVERQAAGICRQAQGKTVHVAGRER